MTGRTPVGRARPSRRLVRDRGSAASTPPCLGPAPQVLAEGHVSASFKRIGTTETRTGALTGPGPGSRPRFADYSKSTRRSDEPSTFGGLFDVSVVFVNAVISNGIAMPGVEPALETSGALSVTVRTVNVALSHWQFAVRAPQMIVAVVPSWS